MKVIITGTTGMVGEGVMHECINESQITEILIINRRASGHAHPKIKEIIHPDFYDLSPIKQHMKGYDACFFCLGVSSIGMKEEEYMKPTYHLTMHFARTMKEMNPDSIFEYISGAGTDGTENGKLMWARVKGKTENDIRKLGFKKFFAVRPGLMHPTKGLKNTLKAYKYFNWMYPFLNVAMKNRVSTLAQVGKAMIICALKGYEKDVIEVRDIRAISPNS
jgi:uncharacterized protein YbjT (DUF2867 family)